MHKEQATSSEKQQAIQRDYLAAFFGRDDQKLEAVREEALAAGMCIDRDGLCEEDHCRCRNY